MASVEITEGVALQQYLVLAKNAKGKAGVALIQQVLSAPNVFVFGELLDNQNIQGVRNTIETNSYLFSVGRN